MSRVHHNSFWLGAWASTGILSSLEALTHWHPMLLVSIGLSALMVYFNWNLAGKPAPSEDPK